MDQRPATAPLPPVDVATTTSQITGKSHPQKDKRLQSISKNQRRTPDSIEEAAASLFTRVRALINESHPVDGDIAVLEDSSPSRGYSTSSYDADKGTSSSSVSNPAHQPRVETDSFYHLSSSSSMSSSFGELARIQTVPKHSVTSSIVRNDSPMPAHYLHSSNPTNIHKQTAGDRTSKLALGRMPPFPESATVGRAEKQIAGYYSQSSTSSVGEDGEVTDGGVDPEKIRRQVLSRPPSEPIPIIDPIFSVIYDSSASSRNSQHQTPDLFAKPLILDKQMRRSPVTPANTVATPRPLISIIPPTPLIISSSSNSAVSTHNRTERANAYATSTVVAHTGASTPEESTVRDDNNSIRSPTAEKGTMTDFEYDEESENDEVQHTPPEISSPIAFSEYPPAPFAAEKEYSSEQPPQNVPRYYTQEQMDELSSYSNSSTNIPVRNHISRTLYEEYILSDPHRDKSNNHKNASQLGSQHRSASKERKRTSTDQTLLPMSTGSFTRIITDLEEMLNQALELAGRAVTDSHTALEQRDASIRSIRSLRESVVSDNDSIMGNAESFRTANDGKSSGESTDEQRDSRSAISRACHKLTRGGSKDVSRGVGKTTSGIRDDENTQRGKAPWAENNTGGRQQPMVRRKTKEFRAERSRIPRPSGNFTMRSARSTKSQLKSEIGQDEQLLARDLNISTNETQPNDSRNEGFPISLKNEPGWDWGLGRKRFSAGVSCAVLVLIGFSVGCYDGEDEVIKKNLETTTTVTSLGNVLFIIAVAIPSLIFWPLSLLHGRKLYLLLSIALTIPLQIPQALSLPPHTIPQLEHSMVPFTVCILVFRTISGLVLGFASMNALATLIDLFGPDTGACCRGGVVFNSRTPIEGQDQFNLVPGGESGARTGVWLGVWAWLFFAFSGVGLFAGHIIVSRSTPAWGFWAVAIIASVLVFLVWFVPEVRPPWKRQRVISRRRTGWRGKEELQREDRGEIKMVIFGTSPKWWWEEVWAGMILSFRMLNQLGFFIMTVYVGLVAGEIAMVFNLLVALIYNHYKFTLVDTGLAVLALSAGALLSVPIQLSSFYMQNFRHRTHHRSNPIQQHHYHEGQHPYRTIFLIGFVLLPVSSLAFTVSAIGPPVHFFIPVLSAGLVVFSGTLVIAECHLIVMDNFDISNLPEPLLSSVSGSTSHGVSKGGRPHGTQRPTSLLSPYDGFTTCHPAITSAFGIFQFISLVAIAGAVGWSRWIDEGIGIRYGFGIFTGISFLVTIALAAVLWRWKEVRVLEVCTERSPEQEVEHTITLIEEVRLCKVSVFQRGRFTRWSEVNGMVYRRDDEEDAWRVR